MAKAKENALSVEIQIISSENVQNYQDIKIKRRLLEDLGVIATKMKRRRQRRKSVLWLKLPMSLYFFGMIFFLHVVVLTNRPRLLKNFLKSLTAMAYSSSSLSEVGGSLKDKRAAYVFKRAALDHALLKMDLFAFIHHADPTKVRIGEREVGKGEDVGAHVVNEEGGDVVAVDQIEESDHAVQYEGVNIVCIEDEVPATVAESAKGSWKKRKTTGGASGSSLPPKKLRVDHVKRSLVSDPPLMIAVIDTMIVADTSSIPTHRAGEEPVHAGIFADSTFVGTVGQDITGPFQPTGTEFCVATFYVSQDMDSKMLCQIYLRSIDYEQLFVEFNVGAARQTCLGTEVRMRLKHKLRGKNKFEGKCAMQANLLKEKDAEVASLKAWLSLKEAEATKVIRLCGQIVTVEATWVSELDGLKEQNAVLERQVTALKSADAAKASTLEAERDRLVSQAVLDEQVRVLSEKVAGLDADLIGMALHIDEEFYPCFLTTIAGRSFKPEDLVYRNNDAIHAKDSGKLSPKWEGPCEVTEALGNRAYKLRDRNGKLLPRT
nr:reverse transcriptase domain-containing protein [Tanacetum cinerariifolium]